MDPVPVADFQALVERMTPEEQRALIDETWQGLVQYRQALQLTLDQSWRIWQTWAEDAQALQFALDESLQAVQHGLQQNLRAVKVLVRATVEDLEQSDIGKMSTIRRVLREGRDISSNVEATAALDSLVETIPLRLFSPWAWTALRERAFREGKSLQVMRKELLQQALIEAILKQELPQTHRLSASAGRRPGWLRDKDGKRLSIAPYRLPIDLYRWWLRKEASKIARDDLLGRTGPWAQPATPVASAEPNEANILLALSVEMQSLQAMLAGQHIERARALLQLAGGSEPQCTAWLLAHETGATSSEIARFMNIAPSTARQHLYRMKQKLKKYRAHLSA